MSLVSHRRAFMGTGLATILLAACTPRVEIGEIPPELGRFKLGHLAIITEKMTKSPVSRDVTEEEWQTALDQTIKARLGRIEGDTFYHLGVTVDGFAVAPAGIPLVVAPKSVLIISVTVFEDKPGAPRLNEKPHQITVFEEFSGETVFGSGLMRTKEKQMDALAHNAATAIEKWLIENAQWFN
jgi:hypothetical protein